MRNWWPTVRKNRSRSRGDARIRKGISGLTEQKDGAILRQVMGYDRFAGEHAYRQLTELCRALRLYVNCFQPSMKLLSRQREGEKVRPIYDPAKTPLQRVLLAGVLPAQ